MLPMCQAQQSMIFFCLNFSKHNLQVDRNVIEETTISLCKRNPLNKVIEKGGPLSSTNQRKQYYKANLDTVEPVEYILDVRENKTFQNVSILQSLNVLLNRNNIVKKIACNHET